MGGENHKKNHTVVFISLFLITGSSGKFLFSRSPPSKLYKTKQSGLQNNWRPRLRDFFLNCFSCCLSPKQEGEECSFFIDSDVALTESRLFSRQLSAGFLSAFSHQPKKSRFPWEKVKAPWDL